MDLAEVAPAAYGHIDDDDDAHHILLCMEEDGSRPSSPRGEEPKLIIRRHITLEDRPSLTPPAHGYPDDDDSSERPPFVLIEPYAYFADRDNATTAICEIADPELEGSSIKATFCAVRPPQVSYLCVHAVGLGDPVFADPPEIVATEADGGLALLRVLVGDTPLGAVLYDSKREEFFVYDARGPSLVHLPHPGHHHCLVDGTAAIVRQCRGRHHDGAGCHNCAYVIAAQSRWFGFDNPSHIWLYHSGTGAWSKQPVAVERPPPDTDYYYTHKTIAVGGDKGTVAWVNLSGTIVLCDVLDELPMLRYLPLPPPVEPTDASTRDVAILGGSIIKYVDLQPSAHGWKATVWSIGIGTSFSPEDWHIDYELDSSELSPHIYGAADVASHIGLPKLSLQEDGIVYFLTKVDYRDTGLPAWVLAVDMRNKTVQKVGEFSPTRSAGFSFDYDASSISKYLRVAPRVN